MSGYSIVDIPGWENLSLNAADRADLERRIDELAHGSVPEEVPRDTATPFRQEVRKHLFRVVEQAREAGAGLICIPTQRMGEVAVPASYTVSEWRDTDRDEVAPLALLQSLAANSDGAAHIVDVDGQQALREEAVSAPNPDAEPLANHAGRRVTYTVSSPDDPRAWVIFNFVTIGDGDPEGAFADLLVELFDAQLTTLRWRER